MSERARTAADTGDEREDAQATDALILQRIVARDPRGMEMLFDRYGGVAHALALRVLCDVGAAEDVVQEAFFNIWRQGTSYDTSRGTVRTWLLTVVHHRAIDRVRSMRAKTRSDVAIDSVLSLKASEDTWTTVAASLDRERVRAAVSSLPPEQRQVVELAYFVGLTHAEIAERVGIPLGTVKGRMRLAIDKLRDALRTPGGTGAGVELT